MDSTQQPVPLEIFAIGTELVMGRIYDTNSFWIAEQLAKIGVAPRRIVCLPDEPSEICAAFSDSIRRGAGVVITTGGLGPTPDDRTVECVARLAGVDVVVDQDTIESYKVRRGLADDSQVSPGLRKMATKPAGATVHQNPAGWAPLISVQVGETQFFLLPGPPREVQAVFEHHLTAILSDIYRTRSSAQRVLVDMHESEVSPLLQEVMEAHPQTYLKAYVALGSADGLPVDVVAYAESQGAADELVEAAARALTELARAKGRTVRRAHLTP